MTTLTTVIEIAAPQETVFDLFLDVEVHAASIGHEKVVDGVTSGLMGLDDTATFRGKHFGLTFSLTAKVSEHERPHRFVDEQVRGPFKSVWHEHLFERTEGGTRVTDVFLFAAPLGPLGLLAERLFLKRHMVRLLDRRNAYVKALAEGHLAR